MDVTEPTEFESSLMGAGLRIPGLDFYEGEPICQELSSQSVATPYQGNTNGHNLYDNNRVRRRSYC